MTEEGPNQGATGEAPDTSTAEATGDAGPAGAGAPINQGAPGAEPREHGESPASAAAAAPGPGFVDEHPEALVGAAFVGGFALAQILKVLGP